MIFFCFFSNTHSSSLLWYYSSVSIVFNKLSFSLPKIPNRKKNINGTNLRLILSIVSRLIHTHPQHENSLTNIIIINILMSHFIWLTNTHFITLHTVTVSMMPFVCLASWLFHDDQVSLVSDASKENGERKNTNAHMNRLIVCWFDSIKVYYAGASIQKENHVRRIDK